MRGAPFNEATVSQTSPSASDHLSAHVGLGVLRPVFDTVPAPPTRRGPRRLWDNRAGFEADDALGSAGEFVVVGDDDEGGGVGGIQGE